MNIGDRIEWIGGTIWPISCEIAEIISDRKFTVIKGTSSGMTMPITYYKVGDV